VDTPVTPNVPVIEVLPVTPNVEESVVPPVTANVPAIVVLPEEESTVNLSTADAF